MNQTIFELKLNFFLKLDENKRSSYSSIALEKSLIFIQKWFVSSNSSQNPKKSSFYIQEINFLSPIEFELSLKSQLFKFHKFG
jgi:hypothetical protein